MNPELLEKLKEKKYKKAVKLPKSKSTVRGVHKGRAPGRKNNKTLVKEAAKRAAAEIYAGELEDIQKHAEQVVQKTIYGEIGDIVGVMADQAKQGSFPQQREFLRRVQPEPKSVDHDAAKGGFVVNINVGEYSRPEENVVIDVTPKGES